MIVKCPCIPAVLFIAALAALSFNTSSAETARTIYDFSVITLEGEQIDLSKFRGQVMLIVNTASRCGFTPQYRELEELYEEYKDRGFVVLGFPSNDFSNQEPGTNEEIRSFCTQKFGVTFPLMCKESVIGEHKQAVFEFLTDQSPEEFRGEVGWNFEKFLIDRKGNVRARHSSFTNPLSSHLKDELNELLKESP